MSFLVIFARARTLFVTSAGPVSMMARSEPMAAKALTPVSTHVGAGKAVGGCEQSGRNALRHRIGGKGNGGILGPRAGGRADRNAAHRFDTAADREFGRARHNAAGREIARIQPAGA